MTVAYSIFAFFFFNDTATTEIYTLSLHDALPISGRRVAQARRRGGGGRDGHRGERPAGLPFPHRRADRSEEHTSELQSRLHLVCRLLLEKKKKKITGLVHWSLAMATAHNTRHGDA